MQEKKDFDVADSWFIVPFLTDKTFSFCGGEPTLNSQTIKTAESLIKNGYNLHFFTNGLWPDLFRNFIENLPSNWQNKISYLFNVLEPSFYSERQLEQLHKTLAVVNPKSAGLGITIYKKDFDYQYLFDLSNQYQIQTLRVSISAPNLSNGEYTLENDYHTIANKLYQLLLDAKAENKIVLKDCNYVPPCFFNKDQLLDLKYSFNKPWSFSCVSSPLDIDVDGNVWRCFGLYSVLKTQINKFKNEKELNAYFNRRLRLLSQNMYAYKECETCSYWLQSCAGGCFPIRINKALKQNPDFCIFPVDDDDEILNCVPKLRDSLVMKSSHSNKTLLLFNRALIQNPDENLVEFVKATDGVQSIKDLVDRWRDNFDNYNQAKRAVIAMCRRLFEMDIIDLQYNYGAEPQPLPVNPLAV